MKRLLKLAARWVAELRGEGGVLMANTWPATPGSTTNVLGQGNATTVRWGSRGSLQFPAGGPEAGGYLVVEDIKMKPKVEWVHLDNGVALQAGRIGLLSGYTWDIRVRDDTGMSAGTLAVNTLIRVVDMAGMIGAVGLVYSARVLDPSYDAAPKVPGTHVISAEHLLLVEGTINSPAQGAAQS